MREGDGTNAVAEAFLAEGDEPFDKPFVSADAGPWVQSIQLRFASTDPNQLDALFDEV